MLLVVIVIGSISYNSAYNRAGNEAAHFRFAALMFTVLGAPVATMSGLAATGLAALIVFSHFLFGAVIVFFAHLLALAALRLALLLAALRLTLLLATLLLAALFILLHLTLLLLSSAATGLACCQRGCAKRQGHHQRGQGQSGKSFQ